MQRWRCGVAWRGAECTLGSVAIRAAGQGRAGGTAARLSPSIYANTQRQTTKWRITAPMCSRESMAAGPVPNEPPARGLQPAPWMPARPRRSAGPGRLRLLRGNGRGQGQDGAKREVRNATSGQVRTSLGVTHGPGKAEDRVHGNQDDDDEGAFEGDRKT